MNTNATAPAATAPRKVGFLLGLGIFLLPIVFVWFLLRGGHSKLARIIGFAWFGLIMLAAFRPDDKPQASDPAAPPRPAAATAPPTTPPPPAVQSIQISAHDLYAAYEQNEIAADQKYKGQALSVTGTVESIDSDMTDDPVVRLSAGNGTWIEGTYIPGIGNVDVYGLDVRAAAALNKGQSITVDCISGGKTMGDPQLRDCSLH